MIDAIFCTVSRRLISQPCPGELHIDVRRGSRGGGGGARGHVPPLDL